MANQIVANNPWPLTDAVSHTYTEAMTAAVEPQPL